MGIGCELYFLPRDRTRVATGENFVTLLSLLREAGRIAEPAGIALTATHRVTSVPGRPRLRARLSELDKLPSAGWIDEQRAAADVGCALSFQILAGGPTPLVEVTSPLRSNAAQAQIESYHWIVSRGAGDYGPLLPHCACGADLAAFEDHLGDRFLHPVCPKCQTPLDPMQHTIDWQEPKGGGTRRLKGGLAYRSAFRVDFGKYEVVSVSPELISMVSRAFGDEIDTLVTYT